MNIMDPNRGGSGRPASLLLWALLAFVVGGFLTWKWIEREERRQNEVTAIYGGFGE